jgi:hypothetical protein
MMADQYFDTAAELGSDEEEVEVGNQTGGRGRRRQNGANGHVDDSSEEEEDDDDEEAARQVTTSAKFRMQCNANMSDRSAKASLSMRTRKMTKTEQPGGVRDANGAALSVKRKRSSWMRRILI